MDTNCIACGMPMSAPSDFAISDSSKNYCKFCCNEDGSMQSYAEKLNSMTRFIMQDQNKDEDSAQQMAREIMSQLPAWSDR